MQKQPINLAELEKGDIFSESSHYIFQQKEGDGRLSFLHVNSGQNVKLTTDYVSQLLSSANIYFKEVNVGKEDKHWTLKQLNDATAKGENVDHIRVGDLKEKGIRTIWEEIYSNQAFTVVFQKAHTELTDKKYKELREAQILESLEAIAATAKSKKGVESKAREVLEAIQANPIQKIQPGEMRTLIGYKLQFESRDGKYNCMDMEINEPRPVNINTIECLVFDGVKYNVK